MTADTTTKLIESPKRSYKITFETDNLVSAFRKEMEQAGELRELAHKAYTCELFLPNQAVMRGSFPHRSVAQVALCYCAVYPPGYSVTHDSDGSP